MNKNEVIYDRLAIVKGQEIIKEGDDQAQAYLIQSGSVGIFTEKLGKKIQLATLGTGEIVGEMALISDGVRSASVEALEDCNLILISRNEFEERLANSDRAIRAVVKMLTTRIAEANHSIASKIAGLEKLEQAAAEVYDETKLEVPDIDDQRLLPKLKSLLAAIEDFKESFVLDSLENGYKDK